MPQSGIIPVNGTPDTAISSSCSAHAQICSHVQYPLDMKQPLGGLTHFCKLCMLFECLSWWLNACTSEGSCIALPLVHFKPTRAAPNGGGAVLLHIQVWSAPLLDLNGHACLVLHHILALHSDDLGVAEH